MAKELIDFSKFKKISHDGKTAKLKHPAGHIITLAVGALAPKHQKQIEELPMHGDEEPYEHEEEAAKRFDSVIPVGKSEGLDKSDWSGPASYREVLSHVRRTNPHLPDSRRDALPHIKMNNDQAWHKTMMPVSDFDFNLEHGPAHSKRDVQKYKKMILGGSPIPPIVVTGAPVGDKLHPVSVEDGRHRLTAAREAGLTHVPVYFGMLPDTHKEFFGKSDLEKGSLQRRTDEGDFLAHGGEVIPHFDDGGDVPPPAPDQMPEEQQEPVREPASAKSSPTPMTEEEEKVAEEKVANEMKQYNSDVDTTSAEDSEAPTKEAKPSANANWQTLENDKIPEQGAVDPHARIKELYNQALAGGVDPETSPMKRYLFGKNGEEPQEFLPKAGEIAQQRYQQEVESQRDKAAASLDKAREGNKVRPSFGMQPVSPQAAINPKAPDNTNNGNPPKAPQADTMGANEYQANLQAGLGSKLGGAATEASTQAQLAENTTPIVQKNIENQQKISDTFQNNMNQMQKDWQGALAMQKDAVAKGINPHAFMDRQGVGNRIGIAIGMALAGFGGQGDSAMHFIREQIKNDIDAQQQNIDKKTNLLNTIHSQYQNLPASAQMASAIQNGVVVEQMKHEALKLGTPSAWAAYLKYAGQVYQDAADGLKGAAIYRTAQQATQNGVDIGDAINALLMSPAPRDREIGKSLQSRYTPGYQPSPVEATQGTTDVLRNAETFNNQAQDLKDFTKKIGNIDRLTPKQFSPIKAQAQAKLTELRNSLVGTYGANSGGSIEERKAIEEAIKDPTDFLYGIQRGDKTLDSILNSVNIRKKTFEKFGALKPTAPAQGNSQFDFKKKR